MTTRSWQRGLAPRDGDPRAFVHESSYVDEGAELGAGTRIWHFCHVLPGARVGEGCNIGQNVMVGRGVTVGARCKIQNNVSVYENVTLEDGVFCGPSCVFTNVVNPRAEIERKDELRPTVVGRGASIGANATIVCGNDLGRYCFVAAGAVVTRPVPAHALVVGVPARRVGWVSRAGHELGDDLTCPHTGERYRLAWHGGLGSNRERPGRLVRRRRREDLPPRLRPAAGSGHQRGLVPGSRPGVHAGRLGVLSAGLVAFAAVSVVADLGTTWSIARLVTAEPDQAWPIYVQALRLRSVAVGSVGAALSLVAAPLVDGRVLLAIVLGVVVALVSGVSELGMATLRAIGRVRLESLALPLERVAFVALGGLLVATGHGANVVLLVYIATNMMTALVSWRVLHREVRAVVPASVRPLWSAETRRTGVSFAVLALGPRANALVLVMLADRLVVADYSVATRPIEQLALAVIGFSTTMLPLLRFDSETGADPGARMGTIAGTIAIAALPGIAWVMLDPHTVIELLYGAGRYPDAPLVLALAAPVVLTWPLRGLAGMVMVAREQASRLAKISLLGLGVNFVAAGPLVLAFGAQGAAAALLITDLGTAAVLVVVSGLTVPASQRPRFAAAGLLGAASGAAAAAMPTYLAPFVVAAGSATALIIGLAASRRLARTGEVSWA
ncbi:MAG: DapH/DapD/GlmU-related protein [Acidimicrobiales bacterium]